MIVDLHAHTYISDGEVSPEKLILEAKKNNVSVLSITDHNTIKYNEQIIKIANENGINFINGIEISTLYRLPDSFTSLHVLGYGKTLDRNILQKQLQKTVDNYNDRAKKIINKLNLRFPTLGLDFKLLKEKNHEIYISRNTLARCLVEQLKNISIKDALKQYVFIDENDSWMIETEYSFQLIIKAGGIPVLAHSGRELRRMGLIAYELMIQKFILAGLQGLEVYHPKHSVEEVETLKKIAKKYDLCITGGSDWHGLIFTPSVQIGVEIQEEEIITFLDKVNA